MVFHRPAGRRFARTAVLVVLAVVLAIPTAGAAPASPAHAMASSAQPDGVVGYGDAGPEAPGATGPAKGGAVVGIAAMPGDRGYWLVDSAGAVFPYGAARSYGSLAGHRLDQPIVAMAATPSGEGYWLVASDGGVFSFGDARFHGSLGGLKLNQPIVGMAATPSGEGYWLVASDGGVFSFGDARFHGSTGSIELNQPVVGMAPAAHGGGYWLVASDGGVFSFGDAGFHGSMGGTALSEPVVGMAATADGGGYWLVAADGGVFTFGDAGFHGSGARSPGAAAAVGLAPTAAGYWIAYGSKSSPVPAIASYVASRQDNVTVAVEDLTDGQIYQYRPGLAESTASTVKVDILATLLREAQAEGRSLTPEEQSLAVPMIEDSLDSAASTLWSELGPAAVASTEQAVGMTDTYPSENGYWGETTTTAADRLHILRALVYPNPVLDEASRAYILNLMDNITPSQDWGATGGVPAGVTVALKNGFAPIIGWQINTTGWVHGQGADYLIAVLTNENPTEAYGIQTVDQVSTIVWNALQ